MELTLTCEQRERLELLAMHAGKTPEQALMLAAEFLLEHDVESWDWMRLGEMGPSGQRFLRADELDARIMQMLRR